MEPLPHPETAVSELIGAFVLIAIVTAAVAIIGVGMVSQPQQQKLPALNIIISNNSEKISIYHNGGDLLYFDEMKIMLDGVDHIAEFTNDGSAGWSTWSLGQTLEYQIPAGEPIPSGIMVLYKGAMSDYILFSAGETGISSLAVPPPTVTGITPASAPTGSVVAITDLAGSGFYNGATVKLSRYGYADIVATGVTVVSSTSITCSFDLTGAVTGAWNVVVINPGGASGSLPNGFSVVPASSPVASFTGTPVSGPIPLSVDFTDTSSNFPTSWSWTFGDGNTSSVQNPTHTYAAIGNYTVSLTVTNGAGSDTLTQIGYIRAFSPVEADFTGTPTNGTRPLTVTFTDLSTGVISNWFWVFGDLGVGNTSTLRNPAHTYASVGNYSVNLTVSNPHNSSFLLRSSYISVTSPPPLADFEAAPTNGIAPLTVYFNDTSTGSPTSWSWIFGDIGAGNTSALSDPIHAYTLPGNYTVTLTVANAAGSNTTVKTNFISVGVPVVANFTATPTTTTVGTPVQFTDTSTGSPTTWSWLFGDIGAGNTSTSQNPTKTYSSAGTYTVTLTASKPGSSNTTVKTNYITVNWGTPTVTSISPNTGANISTISITDLLGTSFGTGATVKLNRTGYADIPGTGVTVVLPTRITCTFDLTGKAAGLWNVAVINPDGQSAVLANGFTITNPAPTVSSITPNTGVNTSTISITNLAGNYFLPGMTVKLNRTGFADIPGTGVTVVSPTQITCTFDLTNRKRGLWNVAVTNVYGQSGMLANGFTITAPRGTLFSDGFEALRPSANGWTETGTVDWGAYTPRTGARDVRLRGGGTAESIARTVSTAGYSDIIVSFNWAAQSLEAGEYVRAEYSTTGGAPWTALTQISGVVGGAVPSFTAYTSPTLPVAAENNANFRLRFIISGSATDDLAYIDDVSVTAIPI